MNIIILGSGELGSYVATLLAEEDHNVTLIDRCPDTLAQAASDGDVGVRHGFATDWELFEELLDSEPDAFLALTGDDATNLVACSLAKNLGYPQTVARVRDCNHRSSGRLDFARLFYVDHVLDSDLLVAHNIYKTFMDRDFVAVENLAHGSVQLKTVIVPEKWRYAGTKLKDLALPKGVMVGLICRGKHRGVDKKFQVIFPHGEDSIQIGDEVTFIGDTRAVLQIHQFMGLKFKQVEDVVIVGASRAAVHLIGILLEKGIHVKVIEKDRNVCAQLVDTFPNARVIHQDATRIGFLKSERIDKAGALVAYTSQDDVNLLVAILAKDTGCENITVGISDSGYSSIIERLGMAHVLSSRAVAANRVRMILQKENVASMTSLYDNQAQILEIKVSANAPVIGIPLAELGPRFPKDFLIAAIHNQGRVLIADGRQTMSPGDTIIAIAHPKLVHDIPRFF